MRVGFGLLPAEMLPCVSHRWSAAFLDMTNKKLYNLKFDIEMPHNCKVYLAILVAFVFGFVVAFFLFGGGKFF